MIDKVVKEKFPNLKTQIENIEIHFREHEERFIGIMKPREETPERLIGQNALLFAQKTLMRSMGLLQGIVSCINNQQGLSAILLIRAHFETTGCLAMLFNKLESFYKGTMTIEEFEDYLYRMNQGSTIQIENEDVPKPINAMKYIDEVDKFFKRRIDKLINGLFRNGYDILSEHCHPNFGGMVLPVRLNKVGIVRFGEERNRWANIGLPLLDISLVIISIYDLVIEMLMDHEELPILFCRL